MFSPVILIKDLGINRSSIIFFKKLVSALQLCRVLAIVQLATLWSAAQSPASPTVGDCTVFPASPKADYTVQECQARVALPLHSDSGRVWVKGSAKYCWYKVVVNGNELGEPVLLVPPNYTSITNTTSGATSVLFGTSNTLFDTAKKINLQTVNGQNFQNSTGAFSFVFYGCFEPFEINKKTGVSQLNEAKYQANYQMRKLFNMACLHQPVTALVQPRCGDRKNCDYQLVSDSISEPLFAPVKLIVGTGDQAYVDAGYDNQKKRTSISTWTIERQPQPLVDVTCYQDHISRMYRHFGSFGLLNQAFQTIPSTAVWDDHEIRDGWGSQGDEYVNGNLNEKFRPYYMLSRAGYLDHQAGMGVFLPTTVKTLKTNNENLHQEFVAGGKRVFAFDLRSNRDINLNRVIDETQLEAFRQWINSSKHDEELVIISSIPLFLGYNAAKIKLAKILSSEGRDDIADGWDSEFNEHQRNQIIELILKNRIEKNIKPFVVSGDVHAGGILELWYNETKNNTLPTDASRRLRKVLCYELISTGLNHETLNKEKSGLLSKIFARQKKTAQKQWRNENLTDSILFQNTLYTVSTIARINQGSLNFGSVEFTDTATNIHLVLQSVVGNYIEQFTVKAEWNKNDGDDRKYMKIKRNSAKTFTYDAPLSHVRKRFTIKNLD